MSGRGHQGGRFPSYGHGGRGFGRFNNGGRNYNNGNGHYGKSENYAKKPERVMLGPKPTKEDVYDFLRGQEDWIGQECPKNGLSWVYNTENPGQLPMMEPPEMPLKVDYQVRVAQAGVDGAKEDEYELNQEEYDDAVFKYREAHKRWTKESDQIDSEIKKSFYSAKAYISVAARQIISTEAGHEIFEEENPVALVAALKQVFLGKNEGASGNALDLEKQRREFAKFMQQEGQRMNEFYYQWKREYEALKIAEVSGGMKEEDFEKRWPEQEKVSNFIGKLSVRQGGDWIADFQFKNVPLPDTMDEAFEQACVAEKRFFGSNYGRRGFERINTYTMDSRNTGYNRGYGSNNGYGGNYQRNGGYNQGNAGYNQGFNHGNRGYSGYNQGYSGHRSYAQVARNGSEQGSKYWQDAKGRLCCLDHMSGQCKFSGNCRYSHEKPVSPAGGNNQGQHQQQNQQQHQQIDKAAKEVQQNKEVRFANSTGNGNPDLGGGGSRKPAGFTGTIASPKKQGN